MFHADTKESLTAETGRVTRKQNHREDSDDSDFSHEDGHEDILMPDYDYDN